MITVEIGKHSITANGHASEGNYLICNSVSVLLWSLAISLSKAEAYGLEVKEDEGFQMVKFTPTQKTMPIFLGAAECFRLMGEQFPEEIKIFEKK